MPRRLAALGLILTLGATLGFAALDDPEDDLAKQLPRIKPLEPEAARATFQIQKGFRIEPTAVEPTVTDPVAACYDADGRLYVVEMRGYPFPEQVPSGNIRLLEDADGDGRFEKSTIFVDGLSWPTSVVPYDGGVFIAVAPDILYAKDTNGDGKADIRKVMFTGFGTQNVQALLNGLLWGPDGWIYGVAGGNGGEIQNRTRPDAPPVSVRGRDFRFRPDGSAFETTSGGGQFGHSFDDWGHRFTCNNSNHIRQIVLPLRDLERNPELTAPAVLTDIAAEGGAAPVFRISPPEPWRVVRTRQRAADPVLRKRLPPTELQVTGFFTSATGVTIYRGTAFPPEFQGNAFIGDVGGNLVHRKILTPNGAIFRATRADEGVEFIASTDNWFRPVNFANTPDGTLLVLDMYRETIEHPASIPEPIKKHLDLTSGHDRGRIYEVLPPGWSGKRRKPALSRLKTAELVDLLADPDAWWRETAQRLLIEQNDPAARPLLRRLAETRPNPKARVHALWTLDALGDLRYADLHPAFQDPEPRVREQAASLAKSCLRRHHQEADIKSLLDLADDPDPMVRFQTALALGEVRDEKAAVEALARIATRDAGDRWTRTAVLSSLAGRVLPFLDRLADSRFFAQPEGRPWLEELAVLVGAGNRPQEIEALLARFAGAEADPGEARVAVLGLGRGLQRSGGSLRSFLRGPTAAHLAPLFERSARIAEAEGDPKTRAEAIRLLGLGPVETALEKLPPLLDARQPSVVQLAALQTLSSLRDDRVGPLILEHWRALGPGLRPEATEALLARPERVTALLDAIASKALPAAELDPARRQQLLTHADPALRARAARLLGTDPKSDRGRVITSYRKALDLAGEPDRGRLVFRQNCATCHRAEGEGTEVGPNLATVTARSPEDLLIHILDPNREVAPIYLNYTVATTDGRVLSGLIAEETAGSVTLKRAEGATDVVPRSRIEAMASTGLSLMPEGLERTIDPQAMADLLAYLRSIRADGATPPAAPREAGKPE
ncbi:MAG: HEAT repeat domain-containing protein [Isosphaeraceae bacterium]|nr:HEAT repeat domain-containing protein [Isosphaeraceae bacterium]